jgi:S-layer protein
MGACQSFWKLVLLSAQATEIFNELPKGRLGFLQKVYFFNQKGFQMAFPTSANQVQAFSGAMYGLQIGSVTMAQINNDITAYGGLNNALNSYYTASFGSATTASVATTVATNLGLTGDSLTAGTAYITAQLNAAAAGARGAVIANTLNLFSGLASDATFGAAATAWNAKVDLAAAYTGSTNVAIGSVVVAAGEEFLLTAGIDRGALFVGGAENDSFIGEALTALDAIDGGAGDDSLSLTDTGAITQTATTYTVSNIETANVVSGATVDLNTTAWSGLTNLNVNSLGGMEVTASSSTDVVGADVGIDPTADAGVTVDGGKNVTLTLVQEDATTDADTDNEVVIGATTAATGAVSVTLTGKYVNDASNGMADISVLGGTTISVTTKAGLTAAQIVAEQTEAADNETITQSIVTVTGNESTTAVTVTQDAAVIKVTTADIGRVGIVNGAVQIRDDDYNSSTSASSIATVTLNNYGDSTVASSALTTLNLSGSGGTLDVTTNSLTTPVNTTLALNVNGLSYKNAGTNNAITIDSDVTTLNINSSTATSTIANITASGATTVNVSGDARVTLTASSGLSAVTAINVTNTKGAAFGTAMGAGVTFTGGDGNDSFKLTDEFRKAITMGAGNDTVTATDTDADGTLVGTGGSVAAGDGIDTISMTPADAETASASSTFNSKFTGFEVLSLSVTNTDNDVIDLDGINSVDTVTLVAGVTDDFTINNLSSGGKVTLSAAGINTAILTVGVDAALVGSSDTINLALANTAATDFGKVVVANVETVNIQVADAASATQVTTSAVTHTLELSTGTSATSIVVTGNNGLDLTMVAGSTKVTNFDASGVVSNSAAATKTLAATSDLAANLAVTYTSLNTTATASVTITGGSGADVLTGAAAMDTISGGAGNDTLSGDAGNDSIDGGAGNDIIFGGSGIDTLTGGAGNDVFEFGTADSTASAYDTITDLSKTDIIQVSSEAITMEGLKSSSASKAAISALGVASFAHLNADAYATLTQKAILTVNSIDGDFQSAMFTHDGSTFLVIDNQADHTLDATAAECIVIKLTGVAVPTADTSFTAVGDGTSTGLLGFGS